MQSYTTPVLLAAALLSASVGALAKEGGDQSANGPEVFWPARCRRRAPIY